MKTYPKLVAVGALAACTTAATGALDFDTLTQRGLTQMTGQQIAAQYVGNTCEGTAFDEDGNATSTFRNVYRPDGTVTKNVTPAGGETITRERTWRMSGGRFCETLFRSGEESCAADEGMWQLDDTLYWFHDNGAVRFEINCS